MLKCTIFGVLLIVALAESRKGNSEYCSLSSCRGKQHTLCAYTEGSKCAQPISRGVTKDEQKQIVDLHNELRQKVAAGKETRGAPGPQPAAKSMETLEWNDELAMIAQRWIDQCQYGHDDCRNSLTEYVGQNVAISGTTADVNSISIKKMVQGWYDEVKDFDAALIAKPFRSGISQTGADIGHYTQFVWAKSNKIGCGIVRYTDGYNYVLLACNYGPGGNVGSNYIYESKSSSAENDGSDNGNSSNSDNGYVNNGHSSGSADNNGYGNNRHNNRRDNIFGGIFGNYFN